MFHLWLIILVAFPWSDANKKKDLIDHKLKSIWLAKNESHAGIHNRILEKSETPQHTTNLKHLLARVGDLLNPYPAKKEKKGVSHVRGDVEHEMNRLPMYWFLNGKDPNKKMSVDEDNRKAAALEKEFMQTRLAHYFFVNGKKKPKVDANVEGGKGLSGKRKILSNPSHDTNDKQKRSRYYWFVKDKKPQTSLDDEGEIKQDRKSLTVDKIKTYKRSSTRNSQFIVDDMNTKEGNSKLIIKYEPHAIGIHYDDVNLMLQSPTANKRELLPSNENEENDADEGSSKELLKSNLKQQLDGEVNLIKHYVDRLDKRRTQLLSVLENAEDDSKVQPKERPLGANKDVTSRKLGTLETNSPDRFLWFMRTPKNESQNQLVSRIKGSENNTTNTRIRTTWFGHGDDKPPPIDRRFSYISSQDSNLVAPTEIEAALPLVNVDIPFFKLPYMIWFRKNVNLNQNNNFNSEKKFNLGKSLDVHDLPTLIVKYKPISVDISGTDNSKQKLKTNANDVNEDTDNDDDDPVLFLLATELANSRENTQRLIKVINLIDNYLGVS